VNLNTFLRGAASRFGSKAAVVCDGRPLSYADLDRESDRLASALSRAGVTAGERVAFLLGNSPEFLIAFFGVVKAGAIAVTLDPKYKITELDALFNDCRPSVLLTESPVLDHVAPVLPRFPFIRQVFDLSSPPTGRFTTFRELMSGGSASRPAVEPAPGDTAMIAYTSGASLDPRGIMLSHESIALEAEISGEGFAETERDIVPLFALPLHHAAGLTIVVLTAFRRGGTIVMLPGTSIPALLQAIEKERATVLIAVPFIFAMMVRHAEEEGIKYDLSSLRLCAGGGSALFVEVGQRFKELYGRHIAQFWGLTEVTAHITCQAVDGSGVPGSVGKPLRGCEVSVIDGAGRVLRPDQDGELICRGPMMKGYYRKPAAAAEVLKDGWLYTGDIGRIDREGNIFITGRKKDLIIPKGQNIAPEDIETVVCQHPKIAEAAAIGLPDRVRGEVVAVIVRPRPGEAVSESEVKRLCLERLANYKAPKEVYFVGFPLRSADGKVDREALRRRLSLPPVFPSPA